MAKRLCKHVTFNRSNRELEVVTGVAVPIWGWSRDLESDVPLLRCSHCYTTTSLDGVTSVRLNRGAWKGNPRQDEDDLLWEDEEDDIEWG